jgi:hypothetical protein
MLKLRRRLLKSDPRHIDQSRFINLLAARIINAQIGKLTDEKGATSSL